jgi:hypothetical protein
MEHPDERGVLRRNKWHRGIVLEIMTIGKRYPVEGSERFTPALSTASPGIDHTFAKSLEQTRMLPTLGTMDLV